MILDSHAHYNNNAYKKPFRSLSYDKDGYTFKEGELPQLMQEIDDTDIHYFIEPGVSLQSCEEVLQLSPEYQGCIFTAIGMENHYSYLIAVLKRLPATQIGSPEAR